MSYDVSFMRLRPGMTREEANRRIGRERETDFDSLFEPDVATGSVEEQR